MLLETDIPRPMVRPDAAAPRPASAPTEVTAVLEEIRRHIERVCGAAERRAQQSTDYRALRLEILGIVEACEEDEGPCAQAALMRALRRLVRELRPDGDIAPPDPATTIAQCPHCSAAVRVRLYGGSATAGAIVRLDAPSGEEGE